MKDRKHEVWECEGIVADHVFVVIGPPSVDGCSSGTHAHPIAFLTNGRREWWSERACEGGWERRVGMRRIA
jgi:hypothetical protein